MQEVFLLASPILAIAVTVSLLINIVQVLTSLQETTISAVPRLLAVGSGIFFLMPWMWRQIVSVYVAAVFRLSSVPAMNVMEISLTQIIESVMVIGLRVSGLMLFAPFFCSVVDSAPDQDRSGHRDYRSSVSGVFAAVERRGSIALADCGGQRNPARNRDGCGHQRGI